MEKNSLCPIKVRLRVICRKSGINPLFLVYMCMASISVDKLENRTYSCYTRLENERRLGAESIHYVKVLVRKLTYVSA